MCDALAGVLIPALVQVAQVVLVTLVLWMMVRLGTDDETWAIPLKGADDET